jgi:hypothetical protein
MMTVNAAQGVDRDVFVYCSEQESIRTRQALHLFIAPYYIEKLIKRIKGRVLS